MASADAFDMVFTIKRDLEDILKCKISIIILTDSRSLFDILRKSSTTREKPLLINFSTFKDS